MSRVVFIALLLAASACSQRSPWVSVPAPARAPQPARASQPKQEGAALPVALATVVSVDALASVGSFQFPVAGLEDRPLDDSFNDARDGGARRHAAIDIMAPRGTPVLSVQDGRVLRLSRNSKGGITVYTTDPDERFVFYYAHLDRYHRGLHEGQVLARGDTLGFVGTTGNAPDNVPHLHFQMMHMPADRKYWNGDPINPYPLLRAAGPERTVQWR